MKFEDYKIAPEIKRGLQELGYKRPTDIQFKSIPPILKGEDVLAIAQTGTGKTAAFVIPILNISIENKLAKRPEGIRCIVLVPTHELALQVTDVFEKIGKYTNTNILCLIGGVDQSPQIDQLEEGVDILIATPGRLFDLVSQCHLFLNRVDILVLDEADHMLDLGFIDDINDLTKRLSRDRQTLFFSATINETIKNIAYGLVRNAIRIQISPNDPVAKKIDHAVAYIEMDDKRFFLERIIKENPESKILVFVRTRVRAERVSKAMQKVEIETHTIHGEKDQDDRIDVLNKFRSGEIKVLIATDISARGIDVPDIDYVINYDLPEQSENYVHRVGRTGRANKKGIAITFCSKEEITTLREIESFLDKTIEVMEINRKDYSYTLESTFDSDTNWQKLLIDDEKAKAIVKKKKKR